MYEFTFYNGAEIGNDSAHTLAQAQKLAAQYQQAGYQVDMICNDDGRVMHIYQQTYQAMSAANQ